MSKVSLALVIHSHQPVGNFDHVIEEAYQKSYRPFAEALLAHPRIRLSLHYSGILLEWLEKRHPDFFQQIRQLVERGQVELVGGGYYEPILPAVPDADKFAQVQKLADYIGRHFGTSPRGAWVAERVWEPALARPLAEAGVEYIALDDTHFLAAGLDPHELHGTYITEEAGSTLHLVPSLKSLRYTIPFREPEETLRILGEGKDLPSKLFAMGDDCEKFGVWPGTFDHCFTNRWLERFLAAIEGAKEWLETTTVSDYLASHPPLARIYLPTASYAEMMEWALPAPASREFRACWEESERMASGERFRRFLHGGFWRNFLSKYPESNQIHKLMLEISQRWQAASRAKGSADVRARLLSEAQTHLLAGQCNDAYWHGVFGGLYAPHLRSAVLRHLIQAETLLDKLDETAKAPAVNIRTKDFDADGQEEILVQHPSFAMTLRPADGATVSSLRFKPADAELVNSLARRYEPYHDLVRQRAQSAKVEGQGPASIHDRVASKEANLQALLRYDRYARNAFRTYLFPGGKLWQDFYELRLEENAALACGRWALAARRGGPAGTVELEHRAAVDGQLLHAAKAIKTRVAEGAWHLECRSSLAAEQNISTPVVLGLELVLNLLAPDAPDRYFQANAARYPLEFGGELDASRLFLVDGWQRVRIELEAQPRAPWWVMPIETVSQSESGFERVYQGSAVMPMWRIKPPGWRKFTCSLRVEITSL